MVRKCKEDADKTRQSLVDAARTCFLQHGVAGTTLDTVAKAAGMTRGAVYWHFANKVELFTAVRDEVAIPLFDPCGEEELCPQQPDPITALRGYFRRIVGAVFDDNRVFEVLTILFYKCEYVADFELAFAVQRERSATLCSKFETLYHKALNAGQIKPATDCALAASETHVFLLGLLRHLIIQHRDAEQRNHAYRLIDNHVLRYSV